MTADEKLKDLLADVLLIEDEEYRDDLGPDQIEAWDSVASIEIAAQMQDRFGCPVEPEELAEVRSIGELKQILTAHGCELA